jgi:outer membrane protein assembly factor BamD (BamD/ComL family)
MYYYQLEEPKNAQRTLQRYTGSYTTHPGRPEALYLQYTMCQEDSLLPYCNADSLEKVLNETYPNSIFAKMMGNEDYLVESDASSEEVTAKYAEAMALFEAEKYAEAQKIIDETKKAFPDSRDLDRILLVESMILGRTKPIGHYKSSLRKILAKYPESSLRSFIEGMLREADK